MPSDILTDELLSFFRAIESGRIKLTADSEPQDVYAGNVKYRAANGWTLTVFNDANEFDYVDEVRSADGRVTDFNAIDGTPADWAPDEELAWRCLGIPGYCAFRCTACGKRLPTARKRGRSVTPPFLCGKDRCLGQSRPAQGTWIRVRDKAERKNRDK